MRKKKRYEVTCTRGIAHEMVRYEGATIISETRVPNKFDSMCDESLYTYRYVIESDDIVGARWRSFGVRPKIDA